MISSILKLFNTIKEDLKAHENDWTRPGFQALLVHRYGSWAKTIKARALRAPFSITSRTLFVAVRNLYGVELPFSATIGRRVIIEHQHNVVVHGNSVIGDDCILRQGVTLGVKTTAHKYAAPVLGKRVDIGAGAKILGGIVVGNDVKIGANAVVLNNVPDDYTAVGIPARAIPPDRCHECKEVGRHTVRCPNSAINRQPRPCPQCRCSVYHKMDCSDPSARKWRDMRRLR